ncbi:NAD(P)-binding protein [Corynespora cassiicola Philippines]|uniref:NAD(P)-binding protein n=1 Tax=Corynespora cassiicola Philippines TaxID=1448308 RepID=A0A2T2NKJ9_CORCC|nr:NAD(P)-binding protein [Corynespora cassiicola Philippines]
MPPALQGFTEFNPAKDIPSLDGKVIFITGGTSGLGEESVRVLASKNPAHIYFSGRNTKAGNALIKSIQSTNPDAALTFVEMDLSSMSSVKEAVKRDFKHSRLDILMNNAGIMAQGQSLSKDGYEIQFATNHLGHAMLTRELLPILVRTAEEPGSDVRIINLSSDAHTGHEKIGISFAELDAGSTMSRWIAGPWIRYAQSKLANVLFAKELARRYPNITTVSLHPGVVKTGLTTGVSLFNKMIVYLIIYLGRVQFLEPEQGALNQLWCAAGTKKESLVNGAYYVPIGEDYDHTLDATARDAGLAKKLWEWTEGVLEKH